MGFRITYNSNEISITVNGNNSRYYKLIIFLLVKKSEKKSTEVFEKGQK